MKIFTLLSWFFMICFISKASDIDKLKTDEEINHFLLHKVFKDTWKGDPLWINKKLDSLPYGKYRFVKLDINKDGRTDLIVNGYYCFVLIDRGRGRYTLDFVDHGRFKKDSYTLIDIIHVMDTPLIVVAPYDADRNSVYPNAKCDTLIYKFRGLVKYNPSPKKLELKVLKMCWFGWLNSSYFIIDSNRNAYVYSQIQPEKNSVDKEGKPVYEIKSLRTRLSRKTLQSFSDCISYCNVLKYDGMNSDGVIDAALDVLEVQFKSGEAAKIQDRNTALFYVYEQIERMANKLPWTKNFHPAPIN